MGAFVNWWGGGGRERESSDPSANYGQVKGTQKYSKDFSSTFYIKWDIYSNVKALGRLSYTLQVFGYWVIQGHLARISKSCSGTHEKWSIVFISTYHINWGLTFMFYSSEVWVMPVLWTLWQFWETGPKIMSRDTHKKQSKISSHC